MEVMVILIVVAIGVAVMAGKGVKMVRHAETMVVERLGKYDRTLNSGINILWPILDEPRQINWRYMDALPDGSPLPVDRQTTRIDLRETLYDFARQNVITKDNVAIQINALVYFQIVDPVSAVYEINNLPNAIEKLTQTTLRNVIGELDLDETLVSRDTINKKIGAILDEATNKWGVKVNRVELQDISPPADVQEAMEKQMRAERSRRATILEAEGAKKSTILNAEGARESAVNEAQGEKEAQILVAEGQAQALIRMADAEAASIAKVKDALGNTVDPTGYLLGIRYIEALKTMTSGDGTKVVYMPYEASGMLGSIGSIKQMFDDKLAP